jgi:hypothetical protein
MHICVVDFAVWNVHGKSMLIYVRNVLYLTVPSLTIGKSGGRANSR